MFIVQMSVGRSRFLTGKNGRMADEPVEYRQPISLSHSTVSLCILFIFSITERWQGNGYLAVYIALGVGRLGNHRFSTKASPPSSMDSPGIFQIVMFLTLGLLVEIHVSLLPIAGLGFIGGFFHDHSGTSISVFLCLARFQANEY